MKGDPYSEKRLFVGSDLLVALAVERSSSNGGDDAERSTGVGSAVRFLSLRGFSHLGCQVKLFAFSNHLIPIVYASSALIVMS